MLIKTLLMIHHLRNNFIISVIGTFHFLRRIRPKDRYISQSDVGFTFVTSQYLLQWN